MAESSSSAFSRLALAFSAGWQIIVDRRFATAVAKLRSGEQPGPGGAAATERPLLREVEPNAALQLLGLLQQEGRFIDFLEEDVAAYTDAEVGAATRIVHEGCKRALRQHFTVEAVRKEPEGTRVTLSQGFDASSTRLTGNVVGEPPFNGRLAHKGWRVTEVKLPKVAAGHDLSVITPAEVEL